MGGTCKPLRWMVESSGMDGDIGEMDYEYGYGYGVYIYIWKATHVKNRRWMDMDGYGWIWNTGEYCISMECEWKT